MIKGNEHRKQVKDVRTGDICMLPNMGAVSWRLLGIRWRTRIREIGSKCNEIGILLPDTLYIYIVFGGNKHVYYTYAEGFRPIGNIQCIVIRVL